MTGEINTIGYRHSGILSSHIKYLDGVEEGKERSHVEPRESPPYENLWEEILPWTPSIMESVAALFKRSERGLAKDWSKLVKIKRRVRVDTFKKNLQGLTLSQSRTIMALESLRHTEYPRPKLILGGLQKGGTRVMDKASKSDSEIDFDPRTPYSSSMDNVVLKVLFEAHDAKMCQAPSPKKATIQIETSSPKDQRDSFNFVRNKLRNSLASALAMVGEEQHKNDDFEHKQKLAEDADSLRGNYKKYKLEAKSIVSGMKVGRVPLQSYTDLCKLEAQIQEIEEDVEFPLAVEIKDWHCCSLAREKGNTARHQTTPLGDATMWRRAIRLRCVVAAIRISWLRSDWRKCRNAMPRQGNATRTHSGKRHKKISNRKKNKN
eukprot:Gb_19996 [translate_table: standard]